MAPPKGNSSQPADVELVLRPEEHPPLFINGFTVQYNGEEFLLTVGFIPPQDNVPQKGHVLSRFVVTPAHAKRVLQMLAEAVALYEADFGFMEHEKDLDRFLERSH